MIRLVVDDAIAQAELAFGHLGELTRVPGRSIDRSVLSAADVLVTRSVTKVDARLLEGTPVRMVASATAGVDHVDRNYLDDAGVAFAHAPGCNARAVVEYVLCVLSKLPGGVEAPKSVGIVGCGQIGGRLDATLTALGHRCLRHDPPLASRGDRRTFVDKATLLAESDVVTLHVPAVTDGPHRTHHWIDEQALKAARPNACIINASRGNVVDNAALLEWLRDAHRSAALDVWEGEPHLRWPLLQLSGLIAATPHIAGYTLEGKIRATMMIERALADHLGMTPRFDPAAILGEPASARLHPANPGGPSEVLAAMSRIDADTQSVRALAELPVEQRAAAFESLRRGYTFRREFEHYAIVPTAASLWSALPSESLP